MDKLAREFKACTGPHPFRDFERMILESDSNRLGNAISVMLCMGHQTLAKRRDMSLTLAT